MSLRVPKYAFYKPRNCAAVIIDGKRICLGPYGSKQSKQRSEEIVRHWIAKRRAPKLDEQITMVEVIAKWWGHCQEYYGPESDRKSLTYNPKTSRHMRSTHARGPG
jgi:hypothetical protein